MEITSAFRPGLIATMILHVPFHSVGTTQSSRIDKNIYFIFKFLTLFYTNSPKPFLLPIESFIHF